MSVVYNADLEYNDLLYSKKFADLTGVEISDAIELFEYDNKTFLEEISEFSDSLYGITHENICERHIVVFRHLNSLLSAAHTAAEELFKISKQQNEKAANKAIK